MRTLSWEQYENEEGDTHFCNFLADELAWAKNGDLQCPNCKRVFEPKLKDNKKACYSCGAEAGFTVLKFQPLPWIWPKLKTPIKADFMDALQDVSTVFDDFVVFSSEQDRVITILWSIGTWIYDYFDAYPYLQFIAPVRSGKTRALDILQRLCYHPILSPHFTPAAMVRVIENYCSTLLVDQAEHVFDLRTDIGRSRYDIFCAGYKKGQHYVTAATDDDTNVVVKKVYAPKALATQRAFDPTIESRSIRIRMREAKPPTLDLPPPDAEVFLQARRKLLWFHFDDHMLPAPKLQLYGRLREIYMPLLTLAEYGSIKKDLILAKAEEDEDAFIKDLRMSREARIIEAILEQLAGIEEKESIKLSDLADTSGIDPRVSGKILRNLGIYPEHFRDGSYVMLDPKTREAIDYYAKKFEVA